MGFSGLALLASVVALPSSETSKSSRSPSDEAAHVGQRNRGRAWVMKHTLPRIAALLLAPLGTHQCGPDSAIRPAISLTCDVSNLFNEPQALYLGSKDRMQSTIINGITITAGLSGRF